MGKGELISIIIPVYNIELYLDRCVDSVLSQAYTNLEVILVDDGSTDHCAQKCDFYAQADKRVKVIHKQNGGLSSARNAGMEAARGTYIAFVDGDDYISDRYVSGLYSLMKERNAQIAVCNIGYVDEGNGKMENGNIPDRLMSGRQVIWEEMVHGICFGSVCLKMYEKSKLKGFLFPDGRYYEDDFVFHEMLYSIGRVACTSKVLYFYIQRKGSIMHAAMDKKRLIDRLYAKRSRYHFFCVHRDLELKYIAANQYLSTIADSVVEHHGLMDTNMQQRLLSVYREIAKMQLRDNGMAWTNVRMYLQQYLSMKRTLKRENEQYV